MPDERAVIAAQYLTWALEHIDQETAANHVRMALQALRSSWQPDRPKAVVAPPHVSGVTFK